MDTDKTSYSLAELLTKTPSSVTASPATASPDSPATAKCSCGVVSLPKPSSTVWTLDPK